MPFHASEHVQSARQFPHTHIHARLTHPAAPSATSRRRHNAPDRRKGTWAGERSSAAPAPGAAPWLFSRGLCAHARMRGERRKSQTHEPRREEPRALAERRGGARVVPRPLPASTHWLVSPANASFQPRGVGREDSRVTCHCDAIMD